MRNLKRALEGKAAKAATQKTEALLRLGCSSGIENKLRKGGFIINNKVCLYCRVPEVKGILWGSKGEGKALQSPSKARICRGMGKMTSPISTEFRGMGPHLLESNQKYA